MTQLFDDKGDVRPVTVLQAGPCVITQLKTALTDGYDAAQIGLVEFVKDSRLTKAMKGHFEKHNLPPVKFMKEVAVVEDARRLRWERKGWRQGSGRSVRRFEIRGHRGHQQGTRFCGRCKAPQVRRRSRRPRSHVPGPGLDRRVVRIPSRVFPGTRMSGHMGDVTVTVRNLRILGIDREENLLVVEGAVPGARNGYLVITKAKKPPRERRGFSGEGTAINPLKASKRAAKGK